MQKEFDLLHKYVITPKSTQQMRLTIQMRPPCNRIVTEIVRVDPRRSINKIIKIM